MLAQTVETKVKPVRVPSGEDRLGEPHVIGVSSTAFKVLTDDSASALFVIEHASRKKGGPPRHLHHNENELFYVIDSADGVRITTKRCPSDPTSQKGATVPVHWRAQRLHWARPTAPAGPRSGGKCDSANLRKRSVSCADLRDRCDILLEQWQAKNRGPHSPIVYFCVTPLSV